MNYEELSFANQQLAGMLRAGIPLEGALAKLSSEMKDGSLRVEFQNLEADLKRGISLREAVQNRNFPEIYRYLLEVGIKSNDLPAVLILLADYFRQRSLLEMRLKGLMIYPAIVLIGAFLLSLFMALFHSQFYRSLSFAEYNAVTKLNETTSVLALWTPPVILGGLLIVLAVGFLSPTMRNRLRWRMPGWREAQLAQTAASFELLLGRGCSLDDALKLLSRVEGESGLGRDLEMWREAMSNGVAKFLNLTANSRTVPGLFIYLVSAAGENLTSGFKQAAEVYRARANYRINMFLWAALPVSVLVLGLLIIGQIVPLCSVLLSSMDRLGELGSGD